MEPVKERATTRDRRAALATSTSPVGIFQGYDTVSGSGLSMALDGKTQMSGGYSRVSYRVCSGIQELSEALGVSESLTASFWSVASVSQKLDFASSLKLTTHSTCIVVSAMHTSGKETATDWALKSSVEAPTGKDELIEFFRVYGDSFLSGRTLGGEYHAVYTFYSESQEKQSDLVAELHAEGLFSVVSFDASVQVKLSRMSSTQTSRVSLDQFVSGIENQELPAADQIIQFALGFPSLPLTSPVVVDLETTGYERVAGIGTKFDAIAANRRSLASLQPKLALLKQLQNDISDINDIYSFYGGYAADTKLAQVKREADNDAAAVQVSIAAYEADPTAALPAPELRSLANGTPSLMYVIQRTQNHVADQGEPFDDIDRRAYLQQKTRIAALQFRLLTIDDFKRVISYFKVTYDSTQGSRVVERGSGNPGELTDELLLSPGPVVITAISGNITAYSFWRSIGFELSDSRTVYFGNLPVGYRWVVPQGSFLLGFSGRFSSLSQLVDVIEAVSSGLLISHLTELQAVYASFRPASWSGTPSLRRGYSGNTSLQRGYQVVISNH